MESIAKYFKSSKKRDLSDGSKTSEEPKKHLNQSNLLQTNLMNMGKNIRKKMKL